MWHRWLLLLLLVPLVVPLDLSHSPFFMGMPTPGEFTAAQSAMLREARGCLGALTDLSLPDARNATLTLALYDCIVRWRGNVARQGQLLAAVHPMPEYRAAAEAAATEASRMADELSVNRAVYERLQAMDTSAEDAVTRYYAATLLRDFRLHGVDADEATRAKLTLMQAEIHNVTQAFDRNINEGERYITAALGELDGLPEDYQARMRAGADVDGNVNITTQYPDRNPIMQYAHSDALRQRMQQAYHDRAYPENEPVLNRMITLRHGFARLLGFNTYADFITNKTMIGNADRVRAFTDHILDVVWGRNKEEYEAVLQTKRAHVPHATAVHDWELKYWTEAVNRARYAFDAGQLRPYLSYSAVIDGVFAVATALFNVTFHSCPGVDAALWHTSVACHEMRGGDGALVGRFYLDMHPRRGKFSHAAHFGIRTGVHGRQLPESALVCNVPDPATGAGLLEYDDVRTIFHEFGHLLHSLFAGHGQWAGVGGISTERDFVEAPSQMLEEWPHDARVLRTFARHHKTGEVIPHELVERLRCAEGFGRGLQTSNQMMYAKMSLAYYNSNASSVDIWGTFRTLWRRANLAPFPEGSHFPCAFGHLNGYSATYYTYLWSKVIAKEMFGAFNQTDLLDPTPALRYRRAILEPGGSQPAAQLLRGFLGRDYTSSAWETWFYEDSCLVAEQSEPQLLWRTHNVTLVLLVVVVVFAVGCLLRRWQLQRRAASRRQQAAQDSRLVEGDAFKELQGEAPQQI